MDHKETFYGQGSLEESAAWQGEKAQEEDLDRASLEGSWSRRQASKGLQRTLAQVIVIRIIHKGEEVLWKES